jgi:hypothetical protein
MGRQSGKKPRQDRGFFMPVDKRLTRQRLATAAAQRIMTAAAQNLPAVASTNNE